MYCCALSICLKNRKALPSAFGFALPISHSVFPPPLFIFLFHFLVLYSYSLNSCLYFSLIGFPFAFCFSSQFLHLFWFSVFGVCFAILSLFTSCCYKRELYRYSALQHDKFCSVSALSSSQCCTVMQTSMRAVRGN